MAHDQAAYEAALRMHFEVRSARKPQPEDFIIASDDDEPEDEVAARLAAMKKTVIGQ